MSVNNTQRLLRQFGLSEKDRVLIVHADDIGMCQSTLSAYEDMLEVGFMTSASVMVPCPWFPAVAEFCRRNSQVDMGVHMTLTCEWDVYRWRPLTTSDPASGLLDDEGYMPRRTNPLWERASWETVRREYDAQIGRAKAAGIDITHIDDHMMAMGHPRFLSTFTDWTLAQGQPPRVFLQLRPPESDWDHAQADAAQRADAAGMPVFHITGLPLDQPDGQIDMTRQILRDLPAGFSLMIAHPAKDTPELRAIADDWRSRVANYEALTSRALRDEAKNLGIHLVGFRPFLKA